MGSATTIRARILVKAYPQPSKTYEETVCVAAVTEDGSRMLRLYPIRYRKLPKAAQFERFDLVEMRVETPKHDNRPESLHVDEDSIRLVELGANLKDESKVQLWKAHVAPSLKHLHQQNREHRRSLGIVRPDAGSVRFFHKPVAQGDDQDREISESLVQQNSLFESPLKPLKRSGFLFGYKFTSDGHPHTHVIHDWEVQAAYFNYCNKYGDEAMNRLAQHYGEYIPGRNLHFILGTMKAHPTSFIIIGLLRSSVSPEDMDLQGSLF